MNNKQIFEETFNTYISFVYCFKDKTKLRKTLNVSNSEYIDSSRANFKTTKKVTPHGQN